MPPYDEVADDGQTCRPTRPAPPPPHAGGVFSAMGKSANKRREPEQQSQHSYEEISALEIQSQINVILFLYIQLLYFCIRVYCFKFKYFAELMCCF